MQQRPNRLIHISPRWNRHRIRIELAIVQLSLAHILCQCRIIGSRVQIALSVVLSNLDVSTCMINWVLWIILRLILLLYFKWYLRMVHNFGGLGALAVVDALWSIDMPLIRHQRVIINSLIIAHIPRIHISVFVCLFDHKLIQFLLVLDFIGLFRLIYDVFLSVTFILNCLIDYFNRLMVCIVVWLLVKDISFWNMVIIHIQWAIIYRLIYRHIFTVNSLL